MWEIVWNETKRRQLLHEQMLITESATFNADESH